MKAIPSRRVLFLALIALFISNVARAQSGLVISQVYGGGGNSAAT